MNSITSLVEFGSFQIDGYKIPVNSSSVKTISLESRHDDYRPVLSSELYGILWTSRNYLVSLVLYEAGDYNYFDVCYIDWQINGEVCCYVLTKSESHKLLNFYFNIVETKINWKEFGF